MSVSRRYAPLTQCHYVSYACCFTAWRAIRHCLYGHYLPWRAGIALSLHLLLAHAYYLPLYLATISRLLLTFIVIAYACRADINNTPPPAVRESITRKATLIHCRFHTVGLLRHNNIATAVTPPLDITYITILYNVTTNASLSFHGFTINIYGYNIITTIHYCERLRLPYYVTPPRFHAFISFAMPLRNADGAAEHYYVRIRHERHWH